MKRSMSVVAGLVLAVAVAVPTVAAPPITGKIVPGIDPATSAVSQPVGGATFYVDASVHSGTPVVPYEYAIRNECSIPGKPGSSTQQDDIVYWTSQGSNGDPHVTMPIHLQTLSAGARCKVFLVRNGTVTVKGSTYSYTVQ